MFKYIKSKLMHRPCDAVKAYITALEKDPTRIDSSKWIRMKTDLWEHASHKDRAWMHKQETMIKQKEMIVRIAVLELTNDDEDDLDARGKAAKINGGQSGISATNHSILTANQQAAYQQAKLNHSLSAAQYITNPAPW